MGKLYRKKFWLRGRHEKNKVQSFATRAKILQIKNSKIKKIGMWNFVSLKKVKSKTIEHYPYHGKYQKLEKLRKNLKVGYRLEGAMD